MSTQTGLITAEQFMQMHFDVPVELVRGEIVYLYGEDGMTRPDHVHGGVCSNLAVAISVWAKSRGAGRVSTNDSGVKTERDPDTIRGADVAFFPMGRLPGGKLPKGRTDIAPSLCIEVLSPSNTYGEMTAKREEYLACGVEEVWIVDPESRSVDVFRSDAPQHRLDDSDMLTSRALPGFERPVADIFEGV
ncbi:Uma2 family endonuclease [Planctomicrobium piriforme]|uniref:Endonuclease, Uma2 family (Restriction endonuclease fold) n=1 Tax=Planctomicrobium piriforme TaxID=1576369 RepID=A0A1I3D4R2_9PLAN|nr:Uma2 family endonuclease [Planctomicrobium piriforme]SFH81675.1 Endonuclease, Uma2 family (restriction endonuclease fold) [Planctomicrobium piriforme]